MGRTYHRTFDTMPCRSNSRARRRFGFERRALLVSDTRSCLSLAVASGTEETKGDDDLEPGNEKDAAYEYSLDPDTRAAEKKLRRVVAKQVGVLLERCCWSDQPGLPRSCLVRLLSSHLF